MKGLLLKDLYQLRRYLKLYALYALVFGGVTVFTGEVSFFGAMAAVITITLPLSAFNSDEHYGWHKQALAMPLSRNQVVRAKYLLVSICVVGSMVVQLVVVLLCGLRGDVDLGNLLIGGLVSSLVTAMMMLVLLPFILKLGVEKSRILMVLIFGGTFVAIMGVSLWLLDNKVEGSIPEVTGWMSAGLLVVATLVVAFISYKVSCAIFAKKEF